MIEIETYETEKHAAFICNSFSRSITSTWPYMLIPQVSVRGTKAEDFFQRGLSGEFAGLLQRSDVKTLVAIIDGVQVSWASRIGGSLLYAYTKEGTYRGKGIASHLIQALNLDPAKLDVLVWTRACDSISEATPGRLRLVVAEELAR